MKVLYVRIEDGKRTVTEMPSRVAALDQACMDMETKFARPVRILEGSRPYAGERDIAALVSMRRTVRELRDLGVPEEEMAE